MEFGLKGKVALITGTASQVGMGKAVALTLAKEGCDIISCDIDAAGAEKTAAEVRKLDRQALVFQMDITNRTQVNEVVKKSLEKFGKIDIFAGIAGGSAFAGPLAEAKAEAIDKEITLNLFGTINCTKAVVPSMIERKYGKIILISSVAGLIGPFGATGYSAAKAGIMGFTRALAHEVGAAGINVNNIAPGLVMTNFYGGPGAPLLPQFVRESTTTIGKMTTVQDIANVVAFLASDVSANITGQLFVVDGGMVMD
jgi:NAD(P)-dependent dehydrogenase (short-subunit alcohol dehydrogenase family)